MQPAFLRDRLRLFLTDQGWFSAALGVKRAKRIIEVSPLLAVDWTVFANGTEGVA